jgi:hypothetical protein
MIVKLLKNNVLVSITSEVPMSVAKETNSGDLSAVSTQVLIE